MKKQAGIYIMAVLYLLAGFNHFRNPAFYYKIIPPYLGNPVLINMVSGISEIMLAMLLLFKISRKWACYGIILMLVAFIPAHVFMLQKDFPVNGYHTAGWILWARLIIIQPLLVWWAWSLRKMN
jgi:uncharacterized membrane protein